MKLFDLSLIQVHERERNYTICYIAFTTFMICTMIVATKLQFTYPTGSETTPGLQPNASSVTLSPNMVRLDVCQYLFSKSMSLVRSLELQLPAVGCAETTPATSTGYGSSKSYRYDGRCTETPARQSMTRT
jgi:hypothetical protein